MIERRPVVVPPMNTSPEQLARAVLRQRPKAHGSGKMKKGQPASPPARQPASPPARQPASPPKEA